MGISKVSLNTGETLIDLTGDTVTADKLAQGYTAHNAAGEVIVGTAQGGSSDLFVVNFTETETERIYEADKTISEIVDAFETLPILAFGESFLGKCADAVFDQSEQEYSSLFFMTGIDAKWMLVYDNQEDNWHAFAIEPEVNTKVIISTDSDDNVVVTTDSDDLSPTEIKDIIDMGGKVTSNLSNEEIFNDGSFVWYLTGKFEITGYVRVIGTMTTYLFFASVGGMTATSQIVTSSSQSIIFKFNFTS